MSVLLPPLSDPLPLVVEWLESARQTGLRNPDAMALATATPDGRPAVRMVLLKRLDAGAGFVVFYSNYDSRKAHEIAANAHAAAVVYWADLGRQVRFEGVVGKSPEAESDAYFATRPRGSQINAWASRQSRPLESFEALRQRAAEREASFASAADVPRPAFWGGYRLWLEAVELWHEGESRFHERVRYERRLGAGADRTFVGGAWQSTALQP